MPLSGGLTLGSAALGFIEGGVELFSGAHKLKQDKAELEKLKRPLYKIQDEYVQNKNMAAENAMSGLPAETKDFLSSEGQRGMSTSLQAILQNGGRPEDIAKIFDVYNRSIDKTGAEDASTHIKNIEYFMNANKDLAGQKNIAFGVNELQPYESKLKEITRRREADEKNMWDGAKTMIGSASAAGTALSNQSLMKSQKGSYDAQAGFYNRLFGGTDPFDKSGISNDNKSLSSSSGYNAPTDASSPNITSMMGIDDEDNIIGKE